MTTTEAIRLQLRSWPDVEAYLERCKGVIVPLGSTEQHGPTGAIGTDALTAEAVASGLRLGISLRFHHHPPQQAAFCLAFDQAAADQLRAHHLRGARKKAGRKSSHQARSRQTGLTPIRRTSP